MGQLDVRYTVFGISFPIVKNTKFHQLLFQGLEEQGCGKWGFAQDSHDMAQMLISHIDKKDGHLVFIGQSKGS